MSKFRKGFTLVETMVVLIISALVLSLTLLMDHHLNLNHFRDFFFWEKFQNHLELTENNALNRHSGATITFNQNGPVRFTNVNNKIKDSSIMPPKNLKIAKKEKIEIGSNGYIDPPGKIRWSVDNHQILVQAFQFGWGRYTFYYEDT